MTEERWWHTIEFPDGSVQKGLQDYRGEAGNRFLVPTDLTGKSVLDFGTWDGFWAIEAKKRGATEVWAADRWNPMLPSAQKALGAYDIPYLWCGDLDYPLTWESGEFNFDFVFFFGILYHLKNPVMGLMNAAKCCKPGGMVIVESAVNQGKLNGLVGFNMPLLWVIDVIHHGDPTNYFMPNVPGLVQLCRMAGLRPILAHDTPPEIHDHRFTLQCVKEG